MFTTTSQTRYFLRGLCYFSSNSTFPCRIMLVRDTLKDLLVLDTMNVLLSITDELNDELPRGIKESFTHTLLNAMESMSTATRFAYEYTRGNVSRSPSPLFMEWNQVVSEYIDPVFAQYRATVTDLSKGIIQSVRNSVHKQISKGMIRTSTSIKSLVVDYVGLHQGLDQYAESVDKHLWSVEAVLWRHFAQWRLQQTSNFRA